MVGDNVDADVAGANAVGMDTALFVADGDAPADAGFLSNGAQTTGRTRSAT